MKKKIIYLSTRIKAGMFGTEKFLDNLLEMLPEYEHIFIGYDAPIENIFKKYGFETHSFSGGFEPDGWKKKLMSPLSALLGLMQYLKFYRKFKDASLIIYPAAIIAESVFVGPYLKRFLNKKFVQIIHKNQCPDFIAYNPFYKLTRLTMENGVQVFVSQSQLQDWENKNALCKSSMVIHNGVKITPYSQKNILNIEDKNLILKIGYLGRIHNDKGLDTLCEALKILDLKDKKIQFSLAGEGEDFDSIKKMYDGSVFHENITINWLGYQKNTKYFFESLDLLIYPSRKEGFALVLLEAWERGLPVLTSDIPPFIEAKSFTNLIEQKLIFTMGDVPSLKEKLELFVSHPKEFINFEQKMFLHNCIQENFSQTTMAKKYKQLFESLTNKSI